VVWLESQVDVKSTQSEETSRPGQPNVDGRGLITQMASAFPVLVTSKNFGE